uniref:Odorant binding protein 16 n=1 Tax=Drosicha corpulenta TaxID=535978 RepID=A0A0U3KGB5_9HEMI|nr:odorant binding protein 16 [Drosicha corpulenta]
MFRRSEKFNKMKFSIVILLSLLYFTHALAEYVMEELLAHGEKCGGTIEDLTEFSLYIMPSTPTGKCMVTCMCKDYNILEKNGKFNGANLKKMLINRWNEHKEHADEIANHCDVHMKDRDLKDECEYGYQAAICFVEQMRQRNYFTKLMEKAQQFHRQLKDGTFKTPDSIKKKLNEDLEKYLQLFNWKQFV